MARSGILSALEPASSSPIAPGIGWGVALATTDALGKAEDGADATTTGADSLAMGALVAGLSAPFIERQPTKKPMMTINPAEPSTSARFFRGGGGNPGTDRAEGTAVV